MSDPSANRVFISCVSDEFEKPQALFPGFRGELRHYLTRADCEVKVQEDFRQTGDVDTVEKLAGYIRNCAAVLHLVGELPGALADRKAVADYLLAVPDFLAHHPDLRAALGDFSDLTYTQWEAFLALHHRIPLFVYATSKAAAQQQHLDRLLVGRKYPAPIKNAGDLLGQLIGDIHSIIASVPRFNAGQWPDNQHPRRAFGPFQSPPLPGHYVRRPLEENRLADGLLRQDEGPGVVVSAVFGLGGIGKSTLAAAVVQTPRVRERFADGVLWVTLGQSPDLQALLGQCLRDLGDHDFRALDVRSASGRLRQLLQERAVLLVVDDAWHSEHVEPFRVDCPRCRLLVTTRKPRIADDLHAISHELDVLSPDQAVDLLATHLHRPLRDDERGPARRLAEAVGRLPLALELAAVRIGRRVPWQELLRNLEQEVAALEALENPAERWTKKGKLQLEASLHLSLQALREENEEAFRCFVWLGVLPDDTTLAAPVASTLWDFQDMAEADGLLEFLWGEALLQPAVEVRVGGEQWRAYRVHDLLHDCARRLLEAPPTPRSPGVLPGLGLTRPEAHRQLLGRYRARTRDGLWHTLAADGYIHGRLGWHLEKAGDAEGLHALLREETTEGRNGWYEANERLGQPSHFADCVAQAWRLADQAFIEGRQALGLQCRCALLSASLNSLASNLPPGLLESLVRQGLWPMEQALAYARRTPDTTQKVESLSKLAPLVLQGERATVLSEALDAARSIGNEGHRSSALGALAPHLSAGLLSQALDAARAIGDEKHRSETLGPLAAYLPAELLSEALDAARAIQNDESRSSALGALTPHLPAELLNKALDAARSIGHEDYRSRALGALAPYLAERKRAAVWSEALDAARAIQNDESRSRALGALAPYLPAELLNKTLDAARSIGYEEYRFWALRTLAPHLPERERAVVLREALDAARSIGYGWNRSEALGALAPHLPAELLSEALDAARSIEYKEYRFWALSALAPHLPEREQTVVLSQALDAARSIENEKDRSNALIALVPYLPAELLSQTLDTVRSIGHEEYRFKALKVLAPHLPAELLSLALHAARSIGHDGFRSSALGALAPHLPERKRAVMLSEALDAARLIGDEKHRFWALSALTPHLPEREQTVVLSQALDTARSIRHEEYRSRALGALAPHLSAELLSDALDAARAIGNEGNRSEALGALAPHLPAELLSQALDAARAIGDEWRRSRVLGALAPHLPERERAAVLREALDAARSIEDEGNRYRVLGALAPHLPERERAAVLREDLEAARAIGDEEIRSRVLGALAPHLPAELLSQALDAARAIGDERSRSEALAALAVHLSVELLSQALDAARAIEDEKYRSRAICALALNLLTELLNQAIDATRSIEDKERRSRVWTETLVVLAARTRPDLISDIHSLVPVLAALAGKDSATELREIAQAITDVARWWP
jgi:hypothetical protein